VKEQDEADAEASVDRSKYVALMIVLPLFLICYGGSCVAYIVYKIYRNCSYQALHDKFAHLHAEEYASQMVPPTYPVVHDGLFSKKDAFQQSVYVNEPMFGAAAAVSFLIIS